MDTEQRMMDLVQELINNSVAATYPYHNFNHTLYVYNKTLEIAAHEKCSASDIRLLKAAALWHDTGYINIYYGHEEESCVQAKKYLPEFGFHPDEIYVICGMIMATKIPQTPHNLLEQIIADADLEYLGTDEAPVQAQQLFEELRMLNPYLHEELWNRTQIFFLEHHQFFTTFCKQYREPLKHGYLNGLKLKL
ncbi:HD domain-containing protein [Lacibacter sp. MH-610]|uniref:HD domain-containing protein n=1 Tax=Lacibacter sp. MH-610 TaxID=3020883 RepID=UPI0038917B40